MVEYEYSDLFYDHESVHLIIVDSTAIVTPVSGEAPTIEETELLLTEENIEVEEFNLDESLCSSDNLKFGSCESSCLRFNMYSETTIPSLEDLEIDVYMYFDGDSDTLFKVGRYIVDEDDLSVETDIREITAYDFLYYIYDYDITEWYNDVFEDETTITIKDLRDSLFEWMYDDVIDFDVVQETTTLVNDDYAVEKSIESDVVTFGFFMQGIMEINGVFGHVDREGVFRYISLKLYDDDPVATLDDELLIPPIKYKDWNTWGIGYVAVYDRNNNRIARIGDSAYRHPSVYSIVDSFVFTNNTNQSNWQTNFETAVSNMREAVTHRRYRSCEINCSGNLCLEVGDRIDITWEVYDDDGEVTGTETFKTYILERSFSGVQEFDDIYIAKGDKKQPRYKTGKVNDNWHVGDNQINSLDGVEQLASQTSSDAFVETIRNIGFRLLDEPADVSVEYDEVSNEVSLKWTDPDDIATNEPVPCEWAGTVVIRKEGSAPRHRWDGTLIIDSTTRDEYSETPLVDDTVEEGKTYYYGIFPYHVALDDADNPIKHYRYTKVVGLYILENDDPYHRFVSNPDILIEKESLNVPNAEVVGTKTSEGLTYTFYDNDLVVITGTYTYNGGYIDLDWWDSLYSRKYAYLGFDLASGVAFTDIRTELVEEYILNVPTGTNEFEIEGSGFASENSLKYLQLLQPCRISSFQDNTKLIQIIGIKNIDTSYKTNMSYMFHNCNQLTELDLKNFITSSVTDMSYMIDSCQNLKTVDVSSFNTSNVTSMRQMFGYSDLSDMDKLDLSHFNVSNVNRMSGMFAFCKAKNIDLHGWNIQHNCNLEVMFINSEVETLNLNDWQLSSTWDNTGGMLQGCAKLQTLYCPQSITSYDVNLPKTMYDSNGNSYTTLPGGNITLYATNPAA